MPRQVIIVQPYVPTYRVPMFQRLHARLADDGVDLVVAHGRSHRRGTARGDAVELDFARIVGSRQGVIGGHEIRHRRLSTWRADLVIGEHALGSMDTYEMLVRRGGPTALWGHTRPIDEMDHSLIARLTRWQLHRAHHFFAYTERGRQEAIAWGMDRHAVTVLNNTIDTSALRAAVKAVRPESAADLISSLGLTRGKVVVYIGALDAEKRVDAFIEVLDDLHRRDPEISGVVAGDGPERGSIDEAVRTRPWLHALGRADVDLLALLGEVGDALLIPTAVGLIAVDALVLGLPVVTAPTMGRRNPELDYLTDGRTAVFTEPNALALADAVESLLSDDDRRTSLSMAAKHDSRSLTIEAMADRFHQGILTSLGSVTSSSM